MALSNKEENYIMKYTKLIETTRWDNPAIPNHTYYLNNLSEMVGYQIQGEGALILLTTKKFYKSFRTFVTSKIDTLPEVKI